MDDWLSQAQPVPQAQPDDWLSQANPIADFGNVKSGVREDTRSEPLSQFYITNPAQAGIASAYNYLIGNLGSVDDTRVAMANNPGDVAIGAFHGAERTGARAARGLTMSGAGFFGATNPMGIGKSLQNDAFDLSQKINEWGEAVPKPENSAQTGGDILGSLGVGFTTLGAGEAGATGQDVIDQGGTVGQAQAGAALAAAASEAGLATGMLGGARLPARLLAQSAASAATGEATRQIGNEVLPESMHRDFSWSDTAFNAGVGAMGAFIPAHVDHEALAGIKGPDAQGSATADVILNDALAKVPEKTAEAPADRGLAASEGVRSADLPTPIADALSAPEQTPVETLGQKSTIEAPQQGITDDTANRGGQAPQVQEGMPPASDLAQPAETLYHASRNDFDAFKGGTEGTASDPGVFGSGQYATGDERLAPFYLGKDKAQGTLYKVENKLENPKVFDSPADAIAWQEERGTDSPEAAARVRQKYLDEGHDGVIIKNADGKTTEAVTFAPEKFNITAKRKLSGGDYEPIVSQVADDGIVPRKQRGDTNETMLDVQNAAQSERKVLPDVSRSEYAGVAENAPSNSRTAPERQLPEHGERVQETREVASEAVRGVRESGESNASRGLQQAVDGDVAVPPLSSKASSIPEHDTAEGLTGINNAKVAADRAMMGMEKLTPQERETWQQSSDKASAKLKESPEYGSTLAKEIIVNPRAATAEEGAVLLHAQKGLELQHKSVSEAIGKAIDEGDTETHLKETAHLKHIEDQLDKIHQAGDIAGTHGGRGLNFRKAMLAEDYSLARIKTVAKAKNGEALSPAQEAMFKKLSDDHEAALKARDDELNAARARADGLETQMSRMKPVDKVQRASSKRDFKSLSEQLRKIAKKDQLVDPNCKVA